MTENTLSPEERADPIQAAKERLILETAERMHPALGSDFAWSEESAASRDFMIEIARLALEPLIMRNELGIGSREFFVLESASWSRIAKEQQKRAEAAEDALAEARRQIAEVREAFLNFVADAKKFEQDIDGEYEEGRAVVTIRYDIETEHHGLWELIDALGFKHQRDETPFDAVCREIEEAPPAALAPPSTNGGEA